MNGLKKITFLSFFLITGIVSAQHSREITLDESLVIARLRSVDAAVARNSLKASYWEFRSFRADLLPEFYFTGVTPNYVKRYNSKQQDDGSYRFVRSNSLGLSGELSVEQNIWLTGGILSVSTSLDYLKELDADKQRQFMAVPVAVNLYQPLFGVNSTKWRRRIEPVKYKEAKANYISATEEVSLTTIRLFFNLLNAKEQVKIATQNLENANHLYQVAIARRNMGQISENELLQLKLSALKADASLTTAESNSNANMFELIAHLGFEEDVTLDPVIPETMPEVNILYTDVLDKAHENNSFALNIRRRQIEADYSVATAKGNLRTVSLNASIGYNGVDRDFKPAYEDLVDNQVIRVGLTIPLIDWGKRRGKVKVAESNQDLELSRIKKEQLEFNQDIFLLTERFNNQSRQLEIAAEADKIARKRYETSIEAFLIGKINTLDLADAQNSKDDALTKYISELYSYWYYYYQLRSIALWDFEKNIPLEFEEKELEDY